MDGTRGNIPGNKWRYLSSYGHLNPTREIILYPPLLDPRDLLCRSNGQVYSAYDSIVAVHQVEIMGEDRGSISTFPLYELFGIKTIKQITHRG
jgi:hypothetical protein